MAQSSPEAPNQFKRPAVNSERSSPSNSNSSAVANSSPVSTTSGNAVPVLEDTRVDSAAHRALLSNELLHDTIDDIRVSSSSSCLFKFYMPLL